MKNKGLSVLLSFVLVLVLTISFSVPVCATTVNDSNNIEFSYEGAVQASTQGYIDFNHISQIDLVTDVVDDTLYEVSFSYIGYLNVSQLSVPRYFTMLYGDKVLWERAEADINMWNNDHSFSVSDTVYMYGRELHGSNVNIRGALVCQPNKFTSYSLVNDINILSCTPVSSSDTADYELGYNAGYSDGLLDGEASVDTETIRNEAYQAGYQAGLAAGSDDTLKEDKVLVDTVTNEFTLTGQVINNFSQQYIIEPTLSIANGSLSYTMPVSLGYLFDVGKDYLIDFKRISVVNSNEKIEVELGEYVDHRISNSPSFTLSGPGLSMTSRGEVIYSPQQTGDFNLRVNVPAELVLRSTYNEPIENDYAGVYVPSSGYAFGKLNWESTFSYEIDVYEIDIVEEIDYLRDLSNKMGDSNNLQQDTIGSINNLTDTTNQQTESLNQATQNQTDTLTGGFDSSSMSSSNTALSGSIAEFTGAESQITDQSFGFIDQVQFYDLNMQPQLLACITFCSSWLQSLFVNIGDWGILVMVSLSLGFGLMLVGWFKYRRK